MGSRPKPSSTAVQLASTPAASIDTTARVWSEQQQTIFDWFESDDVKFMYSVGHPIDKHNLIVRARAGTGKTTTIIEGVRRAPEELILLTSFGKRIVREMADRTVNDPVEVRTLHALGNQYIRRAWKGIEVDKATRGDKRVDFLTEKAVGNQVPRQIRNLIGKLHTKGREMEPLTATVQSLIDLAWRFDLVPDDSWAFNDVFVGEGAYRAMLYARNYEPTPDVGIDFADMIYLPLVHGLVAKDYDMVVVDEAQDMTVSQLELAVRACSGRICIVGDDRQAIYGFRGADSGALDRLKTELNAAELPLTVTYRCPQTVVSLAKQLVPDFEGATNRPGEVIRATHEEIFAPEGSQKPSRGNERSYPTPQPGDFVLSRLNAPLVSLTLRLLRCGIPAWMAGRDISSGLGALVRKFKLSASSPVELLLERLAKWQNRETQKAAVNGRTDLIPSIEDKAETIRAFCAEVDTVGGLLKRVDEVTINEEQLGDPSGYVLLSSVHKAKGLEADRVFLLEDTFYRRGRHIEEDNCYYVGLTRAKSTLILISDGDDGTHVAAK